MELQRACKILGYDRAYRNIKKALDYKGLRIVGIDNCRLGSETIYARWESESGHREWHPIDSGNREKVLEALSVFKEERESFYMHSM